MYVVPSRAQDPGALAIPLRKIGQLKPRSTNEITASNWILGCETLDRDMADYEKYKQYIAPLGIKMLRMQAGWAKTERIKGRYDWAWLDQIIDDAAGRGFQPWLETSYGNPIYPGGGGVNLSAGIPSSKEALEAWDKWVLALVIRYKDKVRDWEVWNEPNFGDNDINTAEQVADLNIRTAAIIKRIQPDARISGLAMGHIDLKYAETFFKHIHDRGKMGLFDNMTYHDYVYNPDSNYDHVRKLRELLDRFAPEVKLRQGENGSPSFSGGGRGALGDYDWTELSQAKWNIRRMLGDLGHDMMSSILGIVDMNYAVTAGPIKKLNVKGLIQSDSTKRAIRPKLAYSAMQHVTSVFDDSLVRIKNLTPTFNGNAKTGAGEVKFAKSTDRSIAVYGYQHVKTAKQLFTIWSDEAIPANTNQIRSVNFTFLNAQLEQPVWVDMISGGVFEIPQTKWKRMGNKIMFNDVPVYDAPVLIADRSLLNLK